MTWRTAVGHAQNVGAALGGDSAKISDLADLLQLHWIFSLGLLFDRDARVVRRLPSLGGWWLAA